MLGIAFGTRPEWLKIKPVAEELKRAKIPFGLIFTGQHEDLVDENEAFKMGASFFHRTCIEKNSDNRLNNVVSSLLSDDFIFDGVTRVMVQGDTSSAFAVALSAFHNLIPVIHLEAGLRTYNRHEPFPEEVNRQMISSLADVHLCPTNLSLGNLRNEGVRGEMYVVGNTVLDGLKGIKRNKQNKILVTMHRRENLDSMGEWFQAIEEMAETHPEYDFILPMHPNPFIQQHKEKLSKVIVKEPLQHDELIEILSQSAYVITDSGGIQEEAAFLRVPCAVCRRTTERIEGLSEFSVLCRHPEELKGILLELDSLPMRGNCPYGDGDSAKKVVNAIQGL